MSATHIAMVALMRDIGPHLRAEAARLAEDQKDIARQRHALPLLTITTEVAERAEALAPFEAAVHAAQADLASLAAQSRFKTFLKRQAAKREIHEKKQALEAATSHEDSQVCRLARQAAVRKHNEQVAAVESTRQTLDRQGEQLKQRLQTIAQASSTLQTWLTQVNRQAWFPDAVVPVLEQICDTLASDSLEIDPDKPSILDLLQSIAYQQKPEPDEFAAWKKEADALWQRAACDPKAGYFKMSPHGVITPTLALLSPLLTATTRKELDQHHCHSDQWSSLPAALAVIENFLCDVQWVLYWGLFRTSQQCAQDLSRAVSQEEHTTGMLAGQLRECLREWVKSHVDRLGYPASQTYFGTLSLGSTKGETLTGADLGILVDISVGDLVVRKVALLQGKTSENGIANVGSLPSGPNALTQLQKLTNPQRDHYLFYHRGHEHVPTSMPTVVPVAALIQREGWTSHDLEREKLSVKDTRDMGYELASFICAGLCHPTSGVGLPVGVGQNALTAFGESSRLPTYFLVVAVTDTEHAHRLQHELEMHYQEYGVAPRHQRGAVMAPRQKKDREWGGPELG